MSHQVYWTLYQYAFAADFNTTVPPPAELDWMSSSTRTRSTGSTGRCGSGAEHGRSRASGSSSTGCRCCARSARSRWPSPSPATRQSPGAHQRFHGERFITCSDGCKWVFEREPEKYVQAWLPVHQIYQGNCGGTTIPEVLDWYGFAEGDAGEYLTSPDKVNWDKWHAAAAMPGGA